MKVSIFTPSHTPRHMWEAYQSLLAQTHEDWEWIVLLNGEGVTCAGLTDPRVKDFFAPEGMTNIGALKKRACDLSTGEILVELDHDDVLSCVCLEKLVEAFNENPHIGFVYSDTVHFCEDGSKPVQYDPAFGWEPMTPASTYRREGWLVKAFDPTPQSLGRIWYAPDHVRAWRRSTYEAIGGHDASLAVCDDYDLLCRTYLATDFVHLSQPLYGYRHHNNTSALGTEANAQIQVKQFEIGNKYRVHIAETWARRNGLALIDICSGLEPAEGYVGLDLKSDIKSTGFQGKYTAKVWKMDLDKPWNFDREGFVGVIRAQDALEHLKDKQHTMREIHRVLAHGGYLFADTPSTDGRGAFQDPTHVSYWNSNSFWYWTSEQQRKFLPDYPNVPHFQMWHLEDLYYNDWYKLHNIPYVRAHMSAVKNGIRLPGPYDFTPGS